jgi:hypothetical protein
VKMIQRWVSIFLSTVILSTLVACSVADNKGQSELGTTQEPVNGVQELFGSSLFLGDSIIGGLTNEDLLPGANVMGGLGATVQSTLDNVEIDLPPFSGSTRFNTMKTALISRTHFALSDK